MSVQGGSRVLEQSVRRAIVDGDRELSLLAKKIGDAADRGSRLPGHHGQSGRPVSVLDEQLGGGLKDQLSFGGAVAHAELQRN
jgi:hypothetical protein